MLGKGKQQEVEESGKKGKKGETASDQVIQREDTRTGSEPVTDRQQPFGSDIVSREVSRYPSSIVCLILSPAFSNCKNINFGILKEAQSACFRLGISF